MIDTTGWPYVDGYRARIGLITPAPGSSTEWEFNHYKPNGVAVLTTRVPLFGISYEGISKMLTYIDQAALMLSESSIVDVILFSCTAGSFINGLAYDRELIRHLEEITNVKATTTSSCVLKAMNTLDIHSIDLVTPYAAAVNDLEKAFLESAGIQIHNIDGAFLDISQNTPKLPASVMADLARSTVSADSDAVFISCTGLHVDSVIEPLEKEFGKPVLTSNQCGLWGALRTAGINDPIAVLGQLFLH